MASNPATDNQGAADKTSNQSKSQSQRARQQQPTAANKNESKESTQNINTSMTIGELLAVTKCTAYAKEFEIFKLAGDITQYTKEKFQKFLTTKCEIDEFSAEFVELGKAYDKLKIQQNQSNAKVPVNVNKVDTIKDISNLMEKIQKRMNGRVLFRNKERRKLSGTTSYCCEYPLPHFDKMKHHDKILNSLAPLCNHHGRKKLFGIYGASGVGKSHFIDYICNEWNESKEQKTEFVCCSLRRMILSDSEKYAGEDEKDEKKDEKQDEKKEVMEQQDSVTTVKEEFKQEEKQKEKEKAKQKAIEIEMEQTAERDKMTLMIRLLFSYFFEKKPSKNDLNPKHIRAASFLSNFTSFKDILKSELEGVKVVPSSVIQEIKREIDAHGRHMVIVIDDLSDFEIKQQRSFVYNLSKLDILIVFSTTFLGVPEFMREANASGDNGTWHKLPGASMTTTTLNAIKSLNLVVDYRIINYILAQFGLHPRSYGMFYHALKEDDILLDKCKRGKMGDALNFFIKQHWIPGFYGSNGILIDLMNTWDSIPFLVCIAGCILGVHKTINWHKMDGKFVKEQYDKVKESKYAKQKTGKEIFESLESSGIISNNNGLYSVDPIFMKGWSWYHRSIRIRQPVNEVKADEKDDLKDDENRTPQENFVDIFEDFFVRSAELMTSEGFEKMIRLLLLLRLNCGKLLYQYFGKRFCIPDILKIHQIKEEEEWMDKVMIDFEELKWKQIRSIGPLFPFAGLTSKNWKKDNVVLDRALLQQQIRKMEYGVCETAPSNIAFDATVSLPMVVDRWYEINPVAYFIELKSNCGKLAREKYYTAVRNKNDSGTAKLVEGSYKDSFEVGNDRIREQFGKFRAIKAEMEKSPHDEIKKFVQHLHFIGGYVGTYKRKTAYHKVNNILIEYGGIGLERFIQQIIIKSSQIVESS